MSKINLNIIIEKITNSDYNSMEELVKDCNSYSIDEIHIFIERIISSWEASNLTLPNMYALLKLIYIYLNIPKIQINFKNRTPIPICYFSSFLILSASLLYSYLKTLNFSVELFQLDKTDKNLRDFIEKNKPPAIVFTMSQFLHVEALKKLVPYLHKKNMKVFIGGIPFIYDKNLRFEFPNCNFPRDIADLALLIENLIKEG